MDPSSESATDILAKVSGGRSPKNTTTNYLDKKNIPENLIFTTESCNVESMFPLSIQYCCESFWFMFKKFNLIIQFETNI